MILKLVFVLLPLFLLPVYSAIWRHGYEATCVTNGDCDNEFECDLAGLCTCPFPDQYYSPKIVLYCIKTESCLSVYNGSCSDVMVCDSNFVCKNKTCICPEKLRLGISQRECFIELGEVCSKDQDCDTDRFIICEKGICSCLNGVYDDTLRMCITKREIFDFHFVFPVVVLFVGCLFVFLSWCYLEVRPLILFCLHFNSHRTPTLHMEDLQTATTPPGYESVTTPPLEQDLGQLISHSTPTLHVEDLETATTPTSCAESATTPPPAFPESAKENQSLTAETSV